MNPPVQLNDQGVPDGYPLQPDWEVSPRDVKQMLDDGDDFLLLDCREPSEIEACTIGGAMHVPMGEIPARLQELAEHDEKPVVVYCHHGQRSMHVTAFLRKHDFEDVKSMAGGIDLWSLAIDPQVPRY